MGYKNRKLQRCLRGQGASGQHRTRNAFLRSLFFSDAPMGALSANSATQEQPASGPRGLTTSRHHCGRRNASGAAPPRCTARPRTRWSTPSRPSGAGTGCSDSPGPCTRSFVYVKRKLVFFWRADEHQLYLTGKQFYTTITINYTKCYIGGRIYLTP